MYWELCAYMVCLAQRAHFRCKLKLMDTFMSFLWVDISPGSTFWVEAVDSIRCETGCFRSRCSGWRQQSAWIRLSSLTTLLPSIIICPPSCAVFFPCLPPTSSPRSRPPSSTTQLHHLSCRPKLHPCPSRFHPKSCQIPSPSQDNVKPALRSPPSTSSCGKTKSLRYAS